jgi:hypothetical protein
MIRRKKPYGSVNCPVIIIFPSGQVQNRPPDFHPLGSARSIIPVTACILLPDHRIDVDNIVPFYDLRLNTMVVFQMPYFVIHLVAVDREQEKKNAPMLCCHK